MHRLTAEMCSPEEKRAVLGRALESKTFSRSEQLRSFLRFVCEAEIEGRAGALNEYIIGVEVLRRHEGYSPAEDSSVRTRAHELRQKLERLYQTELADDPVQVFIPKGSYVPAYRRIECGDVNEEASSEGSTEHPSLPGLKPDAVRFRLVVCVACAAGILLGCASTLLIQNLKSPKQSVDDVVKEAWRPLARPDADVLLCPATPLHLVVGPAGHEAYGSPAYPAPPEAYGLFRQHRPLAPGAKLGLLFTDNVLGVGTMNAVVTAARVLHSLGSPFQVLPERVATISALRGRNTILFGAPVDSDAITRSMEKAPLLVDYEPSAREFIIRDRANGQNIIPEKDANGDFRDVYGLVTVMNTRESDRGPLGMIIFSGITSAGTQGAAEFFASSGSLKHLREAFAHEGIHGFPRAYQVVVRCTFSNSLLLSYEYHSHRILKKD
jgi:hypothetical protein